MSFELSIVTPEAPVVDAETVDAIVAPGREGEFGVLASHEPYLAPLKPGILRYRTGTSEQRLVISGGFAEITGERVTVLARTAERADDLDPERASAARDQARSDLERLGLLSPPHEIEQAEAALARATARLELLE